jgi:REP element-mobilizing transposase RayT
MPRLPRLKVEDQDGWYHLWNCANGQKRAFPLQDDVVRAEFIRILKFYARIYFCGVAAFQVMGSHFHLVLRFDKPRPLSRGQLKERAFALYGKKRRKWVEAWSEESWATFEKRLFNVSEFMRNIEEVFTRWYNPIHGCKGHFWADRFKSTVLGGPQAVLDAVLYVELNGVRAGLAECPEAYRGGSLYLREADRDKWLMPLREILHEPGTKKELYACFKERCYYMGTIITKPGQKPIRPEIIEREKARGFEQRGVFLKKLRCITDGLVFGAEAEVLTFLAKLRLKGQKWALRRKAAARHLDGAFYTLREQRGNYVPT